MFSAHDKRGAVAGHLACRYASLHQQERESGMKKVLKIIFMAGALCVLAAGLVMADDTQMGTELLMLITFPLYIAAFPSGVLFQLFFSGATTKIPLDKICDALGIFCWVFFVWLPLVCLGYMQWFVWLPRLLYGTNQDKV